MRTLFTFCIACMFLMVGNAFALITAPYSNSYDAAGTVSHYDKQWIKIKNNSGSAMTRGYVLVVDVSSDDGIVHKLSSATKDIAEAQQAACMIDEACANGAMCKCQVKGFTNQLRYDGASTAVAGYGAYLGSATAGMVTYQATGDVKAFMKPVGVFLDASSALGQVEAVLDM